MAEHSSEFTNLTEDAVNSQKIKDSQRDAADAISKAPTEMMKVKSIMKKTTREDRPLINPTSNNTITSDSDKKRTTALGELNFLTRNNMVLNKKSEI
jgi:hypothetical protein